MVPSKAEEIIPDADLSLEEVGKVTSLTVLYFLVCAASLIAVIIKRRHTLSDEELTNFGILTLI